MTTFEEALHAGPHGTIAVDLGGAAAVRSEDHRLPLTAILVAPDGPAAHELLDAETARWAEKFPGVPISRAVLSGPVTDRLVAAGAGARLLVVGDKRRGVIARARTGDVPMTVAVVPLEQHEEVPW